MDPTLAAFDVDGTLTTRDTFTPFLVRARGRAALGRSLVRHADLALRAAGGDRDPLKVALLTDLLGGETAARLDDLGRRHAATVAWRWLRPDVMARLAWHRHEGHTTVLVSASLRCYLAPLAELLGVDEVLATELEVTADGRVTGRLRGANCRGPEKARRVEERFGVGTRLGYAYGNTRSDSYLLDLADVGVVVGRRRLAPAPTPVPA